MAGVVLRSDMGDRINGERDLIVLHKCHTKKRNWHQRIKQYYLKFCTNSVKPFEPIALFKFRFLRVDSFSFGCAQPVGLLCRKPS